MTTRTTAIDAARARRIAADAAFIAAIQAAGIRSRWACSLEDICTCPDLERAFRAVLDADRAMSEAYKAGRRAPA